MSKENESPAPAPAAESFEINTGTGDAATPLAASAQDKDDADLPSIILMMRLANMGVSAALMACSVRYDDDLRFRLDPVLALLSRTPRTNSTHSAHSRLLCYKCEKTIDRSHDRLAVDIQLGLGSLRNMRWFVSVLPGDATQVPSRHDCRQLWLFV